MALEKLKRPADTRKERMKIKKALYDALEIGQRQLNRLLKAQKIPIPKLKSVENREKTRENAQKRRKLQEKYAIDVISGSNSIIDAAESAEVSVRQMYRIISKLASELNTHYADIKFASPGKREKMAETLEEARK